MSEKLTVDHIKPRLLGHWGTTPGLCLAYSHLQGLIARKGKIEGTEPKSLFVCGPGHGGAFPWRRRGDGKIMEPRSACCPR